MSSSPAAYKELADAIFYGADQRFAGHPFEEKVTLSRDVEINGKTSLPANTTLRIQRPICCVL